jgi:hypothetical protein
MIGLVVCENPKWQQHNSAMSVRNLFMPSDSIRITPEPQSGRFLRTTRFRAKKASAHERAEWEQLFENADEVVKRTIQSMPRNLAAKRKRSPVCLRSGRPRGEHVLGHCLSFEEHVVSEAPGPIVLCLGTIHQDCEECELDYTDEVRITFLHELGHHLELDEHDLEERGLL